MNIMTEHIQQLCNNNIIVVMLRCNAAYLVILLPDTGHHLLGAAWDFGVHQEDANTRHSRHPNWKISMEGK